MLSLSHFQGRIHQIEYAMEAVKQVKQKRVPSLSVYSLIPDPSPWGEVWEWDYSLQWCDA